MTPEGRIKKALKAYFELEGAWYDMKVPTGYGARTIDFLVCYNGRFIGIETKRDGQSTATPLQDKVMYDIRLAGGTTILENSEALEATRAVFAYIRHAYLRQSPQSVELDGVHYWLGADGELYCRSS